MSKNWIEAGKELALKVKATNAKYQAVREGLGDQLKDVEESVATAYHIEIVDCIITCLEIEASLKDWTDMSNSLLMTGTLYRQAESEAGSEIDALLRQFIDRKLTKEAVIERAKFLAMEKGFMTDEFVENFIKRVEEIEKDIGAEDGMSEV